MPWPEMSPVETHRRLRATDDYGRQFRFMHWGTTTDNLLSYLFRYGDAATITAEFLHQPDDYPPVLGQVFVAELPERELLLILHEAICCLRQGEWVRGW